MDLHDLPPPLLQVRQLCKSYPAPRRHWLALPAQQRVLNNVDFELHAGRCLVVMKEAEPHGEWMHILGELGHVDAVDFLAQWDYGDETTQAALENGYVYDKPGEGTNDRVALSGDYALVVNPHVGYVSLLRRHPEPDASAEAIDEPSPTRDGPELLVSYSSPGAPKRRDVPSPKQGRSWFEPAKITAVRESRGLGL